MFFEVIFLFYDFCNRVKLVKNVKGKEMKLFKLFMLMMLMRIDGGDGAGGNDPQGNQGGDPAENEGDSKQDKGSDPQKNEDKTIPYDRFKKVNEERNALKAKIKEFEEAQKAKEREEMNEIERLKADLEEQQSKYMDLETELLEQNFNNEIKNSGAKDPDYLKYLVDKEIEAMDEDNFKELSEIIEGLKEEHADLFKSDAPRGSTPGNIPNGNQGVKETLTEKHLRLAREKKLKIGY